MKYRLLIAFTFALVFTGVGSAQERSVNPGINKSYVNPNVDEFIKKFEVESREIYDRRDEIVQACRLRPGDVVADIGAGTGLFTRMFAKSVGANGKVYAVDIVREFVRHIERTCQEQKLDNVVGVVCTDRSVELPAGSIDVAFVCDTYHHFEFPQRTLATIHAALKPGGRLILIDFQRIEGQSKQFVLDHVRAGQDVFTKEVREAGFQQLHEESFLKENYFVVFEKREPVETTPPTRPQSPGQKGAGKGKTQNKPTEAKWVLPKVDGRNLHYKTFKSVLAREEVSYLIYLPPSYATDSEKRFPVMYWLHGIGGGQQGVPAMVERFDDAIRQAKTPPMLVVFVNGLSASMYCDSADGKRPVESVIVQELIPHIDQTYRTIARREGRLIEGFSMGGFGATRLGFKYPDLFGAVSSLAGALHTGDSLQQRHADLVTALFADDVKKRDAAVPSSIAEKNADALRDKMLIRLAVGDRDPTFRHNGEFDAHLTRLKIPHSYRTLPGVRHNPNEIYEALGESTWAFYRQAFGLRE